MYKPVVVSALAALGFLGWQDQRADPPQLLLKEERMTIEYTVGVEETVIKIKAESEEALGLIELREPHGGSVLKMRTSDRMGLSLQGFELETAETSTAEVMQTFSEGRYTIRAVTSDGRTAFGSAMLDHDLLEAVQIVYPLDGSTNVPTTNLNVEWTPNPGAKGGYVVVIEQEDNEMEVLLPEGTSKFTVPDGYLLPGTETQVEVGAIADNGNCTLVEAYFTTQ